MYQQTACNHSNHEPPAPVTGGMRWRKPWHDIFDRCRRDGGFILNNPDAGVEDEPAAPATEPETMGGPRIVSIPPREARVGEEYAHQARAYDSNVDGFTWYFEKGVSGMTVDRHTGMVRWIPSEGGYVEVTLCARSAYGAEARLYWTVCVRKAAAVHAFRPSPRFVGALRRKAARDSRPLPRRWRGSKRQAVADLRATAPPREPRRAAMPLRI